MNTYKFSLEIPAGSVPEAKAKFDLMLQMAAFCKDFNAAHLAASYLNYFVWSRFGRHVTSANTFASKEINTNTVKPGNLLVSKK